MHQAMHAAAGRDARPTAPPMKSGEFRAMLVGALPRLRVHALSLTRSRPEADDLVQDAVALALRSSHRFEPGTNFAAWSHSIVRNRFFSLARQRRRHVELDDKAVAGAARYSAPQQDGRLVMKELARMLGRLPVPLREALILVVVQGRSYDEVAALQGCAVGTAK